MFYILYGEPFWARSKLAELLVRAKERNYEVFKLEEGSSSPLNSFLSRGLFGRKIFLVLEHLLDNPEYSAEIKALAQDLAKTENIAVLFEEELSETWEKVFKKAGAKLQEFKNPPSSKLLAWLEAESKKRDFDFPGSELKLLISEIGDDPYALLNKLERLSLEKSKPLAPQRKAVIGNYFQFTDLVSGKQKYQALRLLRQYIKEGLGAEEAFWKLWWKVKTLRIVDSGKKNTGLHPFVEKKALADLKNFSSEELKQISYELLDLFSEVRRGETTFEEGLEKILLKV